MSHEAAIPPVDDYTFPTNSTEVVFDELRTYKSGDDMRDAMVVFKAMHGNAAIARSFERASRLLFLANVHDGLINEPQARYHHRIDDEFYAGSIFALHAAVLTLHPDRRRWVYAQDYLGLSHPELLGDEGPEQMRAAIDTIQAFRRHDWQEYFESMREETQMAVYETAVRLYEDTDRPVVDPVYRGDSFMSGFAYSMTNVRRALDTFDPSTGRHF